MAICGSQERQPKSETALRERNRTRHRPWGYQLQSRLRGSLEREENARCPVGQEEERHDSSAWAESHTI